MSVIEDTLTRLESDNQAVPLGDVLLWPRTPIHHLQEQIAMMQGTGDLSDDAKSRPRQIIVRLAELVSSGELPSDFSIVDICCGDGLVLWRIQQAFPQARCYGVDMNKGTIETHTKVQAAGVRLFKIPIQSLFESDFPDRIDVVMMLNTYRGWSAAELRSNERELPDRADRWMEHHARRAILTMTETQMATNPWRMCVIGAGEQATLMVEATWTI